jgi:hypothetical protein
MNRQRLNQQRWLLAKAGAAIEALERAKKTRNPVSLALARIDGMAAYAAIQTALREQRASELIKVATRIKLGAR